MYNDEKVNELKRANKLYFIIDLIIIILNLVMLGLSLYFVDYTNVLIYCIFNCLIVCISSWFIIYSIVSVIRPNKALIKHFNLILQGEKVSHKVKIIGVEKNITIHKNIICDTLEVEEDGLIYKYNILSIFNGEFREDTILYIDTINNFITFFRGE